MKFWALVLLRAVILFGITLALVRLTERWRPSRRDPFGPGGAFGLIRQMVIGVIAALTSLAIINNMAMGLLVLAVWTLLPLGLDALARQSRWLDALWHGKAEGRACVLIKEGKIVTDNLWRARLSGDELLRELHAIRRIKLSDVEFAVMENDGRIQVFPKADYRPGGRGFPDRHPEYRVEPQTVAYDGQILATPLADLGLTPEWLETELRKKGVALADVLLAQADAAGDLYLDLRNDTIHLPQPKVREMVYANLLKVRADLMTYALETKDPAARAMYAANAAKMKTLLGKLKPYLLH